jgi:hypothetical protein
MIMLRSIPNATLQPEEAPGGTLDKYQDWVDWLWTTMSTRAAFGGFSQRIPSSELPIGTNRDGCL